MPDGNYIAVTKKKKKNSHGILKINYDDFL